MDRSRTGKRPGPGAGLSQQLLRDRAEEPARRRDPRAPGDRRHRLAQDRRGALRLRAAPGLGAPRKRATQDSSWSRGRPKTFSRSATRYEATVEASLRPLDDAGAEPRSMRRFEGLSREGFRVLGIAWHADADAITPTRWWATKTELVFAGFAAFLGPARRRAPKRPSARLTASGVAVKVVTGDNELVTQHVVRTARPPGQRACSPAARSRRWTTRRSRARVEQRESLLPGDAGPEEPGDPGAEDAAATWSAISATASTTRRPSIPPTSAFRWTPPSTWRRMRRT